jgi:hypothetical protein
MIAEVKPTSTQSIRLLYIVSKLIFSASIVFSLIISSVLIFGTINSNSSSNDLAIEKQFNSSTVQEEILKTKTVNFPLERKHRLRFAELVHVKYVVFKGCATSKKALILVSTLLVLTFSVLCAYYFMCFMRLIVNGAYFERKTINNLKRISYLILGIWGVRLISSVAISVLFETNNTIHPISNFKLSTHFPSISILIIALILWVLSYVFTQGARIQEENELTI